MTDHDERDFHQEYKDDLAQGYICPDGTGREPDEPDWGQREAREQVQIPESILRTWPSVPADAWERLSQHRYRAGHPVDEFVWCVVVVFGETIGRPASAGNQAMVYAELFEHAARLAAHRVACQEGTPVVRSDDDEANWGVVGRCWWCGKWPKAHIPDGTKPARVVWDEIVRDPAGGAR